MIGFFVLFFSTFSFLHGEYYTYENVGVGYCEEVLKGKYVILNLGNEEILPQVYQKMGMFNADAPELKMLICEMEETDMESLSLDEYIASKSGKGMIYINQPSEIEDALNALEETTTLIFDIPEASYSYVHPMDSFLFKYQVPNNSSNTTINGNPLYINSDLTAMTLTFIFFIGFVLAALFLMHQVKTAPHIADAFEFEEQKRD